MDRLQELLKSRDKPFEKVSHAIERSRLNNEDRKYNQIVYDNELKQANLYNQSSMPNTGKDIGVGFKINVYVIRLTQLLSVKADLEKALSTFFATGMSVQRLRGATREAQVATDFFKKADILSTYNELMLYIKTYAQDIINDDAFKAQVFNTSFNPLIQLFLDTASLYPTFFNQLPAPSMTRTIPPAERAEERKVYETAREQSIGCYSLLNTMATFMNNLIFRPIVKDDVSKYISDNNVKEIFKKNPQAPEPIAPQQPPEQAPQDPNAPPPPIAPALPVLDPNDDQIITGIVENYMQQVNRILFRHSSNDAQDAIDAVLPNFQPLDAVANRAVVRNVKTKIGEIRTALGLPDKSKPTQANIQTAEQAYQQYLALKAQQAPPAPQPVPPAPQQDPNRVAYEQAGGTVPLQVPELDQAESAQVWAVYKQLENQLGTVISPKAGDLKILYDALPQPIQDKIRKAGTPDELPEATAIQDSLQGWVTNIMQQRQAWGNQQVDAQGQPAPVQSATLYGLGRERNNNLAMNAILDFEQMARRPSKESDIDIITELNPELDKIKPKIRFMINKLRQERISEPHMWGKGKHENQQGIKQRAGMLPQIMEYDPKAEALKRGIIMSGGCDTCSLRGGMDNREWGYSGYGEVEDEESTPFKRMIIGMPNPFSGSVPATTPMHKFMPYDDRFEDEEDRDYYANVLPEEGTHYAELEKPVDLDERADHIRKNNENWKLMTGKMKAPKYKN